MGLAGERGGSFLPFPHESTVNVLYGHILHIETHVVTGQGLTMPSPDLTSVVMFVGAKVTNTPGFRELVSTKSTDMVPMPVPEKSELSHTALPPENDFSRGPLVCSQGQRTTYRAGMKHQMDWEAFK